MSPILLLLIVVLYFSILVIISKVVEKNSNADSFFTGNKQSPWYLVAFGMIGASLSGVTFISIPGAVALGAFGYFQMVLGFVAGYAVIALVLLPLYYKLNLTTIYTYLQQRFGRNSQLIGAGFFMLSRVLGASLRMYLVVLVLQTFIFNSLGIHFSLTIGISLILIWIYTSKAGIKTIVYTDTLQTLFMLIALFATIIYIMNHFDFEWVKVWNEMSKTDLFGKENASITNIFTFDKLSTAGTFWKMFTGGMFIAIAMTGLDQDMMQKNLTCPNIKEAQKNVLGFTITLVVVNALFLFMGALLYYYIIHENTDVFVNSVYDTKDDLLFPADKILENTSDWLLRTDLIFPHLSLNYFGTGIGIIFFIGLIAAAYSSADSALTSLTTSFCFDVTKWNPEEIKQNKSKVHIAFSIVLYVVIFVFYLWNDTAAINTLFRLASYTYGPLIGLFFFGILTDIQINDKWVPVACVASPILCYLINEWCKTEWGYYWGYELLLLNGFITFALLYFLPKQPKES